MFKVLRAKMAKNKQEKDAMLAIAAQQNKYLIECKNDIKFLQKMVELVNKDPDLLVEMFLVDGTRLVIRSTDRTKRMTTAALFNGDE